MPPRRVEADHRLAADHLGTVNGPARDGEAVARFEHGVDLAHRHPEAAGYDRVDLVDAVRVRREPRARRIDVARHRVAARLDLAAQRRLGERPLGGGVPVLDAHSPACSFT